MSVFSSIKNWFKKTFGGGSSSSTKRASRVSNYGGGGSRSYRDYAGGGYASDYESRQQREARERKERKAKQDKTTNALASISKRTDSLASGRSSSVASSATHATSGQGTARVLAKINEKGKKAPPDPKQKRLENTKTLKQIADDAKKDRAEFNKATGNKYNVDKNGTKARIAQKSQAYDVKAEKYEMEKHPIATSAGRGALSGVTFGGSEILASTSKNRRRSGAEAHYQANKNTWAEMGGEIAGSLAAFGLTEGAATRLAGKVAPNVLKRGGESAVRYLTKNSAFRAAAKAEAERTGIKVTEEVLEKFAKQRAQRLVNAVGQDMAINWTTGGVMDVNQSIRDTLEDGDASVGEFAKNLAKNRAINYGLGGAVTVLPALRKTKGIINIRARDDALKLALEERKGVEKLLRGARQAEADNALSPIKLTSKENLREQLGNIVRREDAPIASAGRREMDALSAPRIGESLDDTIARRAAQSAEQNAVDRQMPQMRQAMQDAFAQNADEARRVDMNEILAQNSPLRQTDETVRPQNVEDAAQQATRRADQAYQFPDAETYIRELDERGEQWLGQYGHITANEDGTYNLFRNGVGDRTLSREEATDYISRARDALQNEEIARAERERVTRTTPLSEAENARLSEIDDEISRLREEGRADADELRRNRYNGLDEYDARQAELAGNERKLSNERDNIVRKEPPKAENAARNAEQEVSNASQVDKSDEAINALRDENIPLEEKERIHQMRIDEIDRELDVAYERGDTEYYDALSEEAKQLDEALREAENAQTARPQVEEPATTAEAEFPYEGTPEAEEMLERQKNRKKSKKQTKAETPEAEGTAKGTRNKAEDVNEEIHRAMDDETKGAWTGDGTREKYTSAEAEDLKSKNYRDSEKHTKQGATTVGVGMGDKQFEQPLRDAIEKGEFTTGVYRDKENYEKGAKRVVDYANGKGGSDGKGDLNALASRFERYASGKEKVSSDEARDMLYDILAAVDYSNGLAKTDPELAERLFLSATKAGAELTSVSGLSLRQWQKIAMSSPDYRAKAAVQQIEAMFNKNKGFRKKFGKLEGRLKTLEEKSADLAKQKADLEEQIKNLKGEAEEVAQKKADLEAQIKALDERGGNLASVDEEMPGLEAFIKENPEDTKGLSEALDALRNAKTQEEVEQAASHAILEARKVMPVTAFDQLTQWRYVAMLSSPTTHVKNILGNIYSATLGQTSGAIGSAIENHLIRSGKVNAKVNLEDGASVGSEYLKSSTGYSWKAVKHSKIGIGSGIKLNNLKDKLKTAQRELKFADENAKEAAQKKVADLEKQIEAAQKEFDTKKPKDMHGAKAQELFHSKSRESLIADAEKWEMKTSGASGKLVGKASKFVGDALETSDAVAVEAIYRETAEKVLRANDYEKWVKLADSADPKKAAAAKAKVKQIEEYAAQHGAYRAALDTYRNYNAVASWMNKTVQNTLYNADAIWYKKAGGFLLHAVMPFTKVPTNILKRSVDYSPIGLIQGKKALNKALETGDYAEINKAVERLSEGLVGTGIASLGFGMGMVDPDGMTITTRLDREDAKDKAKKDRGYMDYSVRAGNRDFTLEWATPTASTFFTGVEAGRVIRGALDSIASKNGLEFNPWASFDVASEIISTIIEPNLQLTMFQGINSIIDDSTEQKYGEANISPIAKIPGAIAKNYLQSLSPSLMNRLSRAFSPYDYYISGSTNLEYRKNLALSKIPGLSAKTLEAKTDAWGNIKNEKKTTGEKVASAAITLFSPANVSKITWDDTDEALYKLSEETGKDDFLPKVFYDYNNEGMTFGKNKDTAVHVDLSNNDAARYNIAKGKAGSDAMHAAMESVIFNRWSKDSTGHYTIEDPKNYSAKQKAEMIAKFEGKGTKDVVEWVMAQPEYKNATPSEQVQVLKNIVGNGTTSASMGAKRAGEWAVAERHGMSRAEYDYRNEVQERVQKNLDEAIADGVITYDMAVAFARDAGKTYYRTDADGEEGGTVTTYYNKAQMMEYLNGTNYTEEQKAALYNAFKQEQTKEYGSSSYRRRYGRRRYGYRRRGGGSSGSGKVPAPKTIKASSLKKGEALVSKKSSSSTKVSAPKLERVKAKIDLPEAKW